MNEAQEPNTTAAVASPALPASPGALLRQAREATGLHVAALAVSLKVSVKKIEALEADRFDLLPDMVFVRALAASVCRVLKIDAAPVLALMPQSHTPKLNRDEAGINTPFRAPNDQQQSSRFAQLSKPVMAVAALLLLGALVIAVLPNVQKFNSSATQSVETLNPPALTASAAVATPTGAVPASGNESLTGAPSAVGVITEAPAANPSPSSLGVTAGVNVGAGAGTSVGTGAGAPAITTSAALESVAKAGSAKPAAAPAEAAQVARDKTESPQALAGTGDLLRFKTRAQSWVEVIDARGKVVFSKTMQAGESASAAGTTPLEVVIGKANVTEVLVRGKSYDLNAVARDNVARFSVK